MSAIGYQQIIEALESTLNEITDIGKVSRQPAVASPWSESDNNVMPLFEMEIASTASHKLSCIPGAQKVLRARKHTTVVVEGWYPKSIIDGSDAIWSGFKDAVMSKLEAKRGLGIPGLILVKGPMIQFDGIAPRSSIRQSDLPIECHMTRLLLSYEQEYSFEVVG